MQSPKRQQGMTAIGWLIVLVLIGFFAMLAIKLGPVYMEHYTVQQALESLKTQPDIASKSSREIKSLLFNRLDINYVQSLPREKVKVKKSGGVVKVDITYEVRRKMVGNIDAVVSFSDKLELTPR